MNFFPYGNNMMMPSNPGGVGINNMVDNNFLNKLNELDNRIRKLEQRIVRLENENFKSDFNYSEPDNSLYKI